MSSETYPVVDLFAGPGGLGEGFSSCREGRAFRIVTSIEMDRSAARTLRFRAFMRLVRSQPDPLEIDFGVLEPNARDAEDRFLERAKRDGDEDDSVRIDELWEQAGEEALCAELGSEEHRTLIETGLDRVGPNSVLIGGPPCQAYSLVGRVRNQAKSDYTLGKDKRHKLYEHYVDVIRDLEPAAFVMENVKGILSARTRKAGVFGKIVKDLEVACADSHGGYVLCPLTPRAAPTLGFEEGDSPDPYDYVIRSEHYGVAQARHRVIVVGIRRDLAEAFRDATDESVRAALARAFGAKCEEVGVGAVLAGLPALTSRVSRRNSPDESWAKIVLGWAQKLGKLDAATLGLPHEAALETFRLEITRAEKAIRGDSQTPLESSTPDEPDVVRWITGTWSGDLKNHVARSHMAEDLGRYLFAAAFGRATGVSPKQPDFPKILAPKHKNWESGKFADRFRVQVEGRPATTVTSHISKDGHYFIHPDPAQCRSLTVREAARIQSFPDDYIFLGNRTEQYVQVGNAVPPFLARRIARALYSVLSRAM